MPSDYSELLRYNNNNDLSLLPIAAKLFNIDLNNYSEDDIKVAFRKLTTEFHPDIQGDNNNSNMQIINVAHKLLRDNLRKKEDVSSNSADVVDTNEYVAGTSIKRPRNRDIYESDDEYVEYLKNYYDKYFSKSDENELNSLIQKRNKLTIELSELKKEIDELLNEEINMYSNSFNYKQEDMEFFYNNRQKLNKKYEDILSEIKNIQNKINDITNKSQANLPIKNGQPSLPSLDEKLALPASKDNLCISAPKDILGLPESVKKGYPPKPKDESISSRNLDDILDDITSDLFFKEKDNKKYTASNIKVNRSFVDSLRSGNYLYNIVHFIPALVGYVFSGFKKLKGKLTYNSKIKENVETLKNRLDNLSESDLMILFDKYHGSNVVGKYGLPSIVNTVISERIRKFVIDKVQKLNLEITKGYQTIYNDYEKIVVIKGILENPDLKPEMRATYTKELRDLCSGKAELIKGIRDMQDEVDNKWLSGGGLHGFEEDIKAATTKLSYKGKRFAKIPSFDSELLHIQRMIKDKEEIAIKKGNDEEALFEFLNYETLLSNNTSINNSVFGKRSTGSRYYNPLSEELDYKDDMFVRDIFTSIAIAGATVSAINGLVTQIKIKEANSMNEASINQAHQVGNGINSKNDVILEGERSNVVQGQISGIGTSERWSLDANDWNLASKGYKTMDATAHQAYNQMYENTNNSLSSIANNYASGSISSLDALKQMADLTANAQSQLQSIYSTYFPVLQKYASTHSFNLNALEQGLQYMMNNSNAISDATTAQYQVAQMASSLQALQTVGAPSDILTTLGGSISSLMLAMNVTANMKANYKKNKYGNAVTEMMEDIDTDSLRYYTDNLHATKR